jgi:hypothetical protein
MGSVERRQLNAEDTAMRAAAVFTFAFFLCLSATVKAQEFEVPEVTYPELQEQGEDAQSFVPKGWVLEKEIRGDLNEDGTDDLVLVLHNADPANMLKTEWAPETPVDTNARMLAVALAGSGGYRLVVSDHDIIPRVISLTESDPLSESGGVSIDRGSLLVSIYYFSSAGGSDTGHMDFRFRYEDEDFRLIGFDRVNVNRMSGEIKNVSVNYLNRKVVIKTGSIESDVDKVTTGKLKSAKIITIDDVSEPWAFEPEY